MRAESLYRQWRSKGQAAWRGLAMRERRALGLTATLLASLAVWLLLIEPPLARIAHWQVETPKLRSQAQALDQLLAQTPRPASAEQRQAALQRSLANAGLQAHGQLQADADGWQLNWQQAPAEAALAWLLDGPRQEALAVAEAHLQRDPLASPEAAATLSGSLRLHPALDAKDSP